MARERSLRPVEQRLGGEEQAGVSREARMGGRWILERGLVLVDAMSCT